MEFSTNHLLKILNELPKGDRYLVAFSGGLDSTVLLHALAGLRERLSGGLVAVHVDHGLQPDSSRITSYNVCYTKLLRL